MMLVKNGVLHVAMAAALLVQCAMAATSFIYDVEGPLLGYAEPSWNVRSLPNNHTLIITSERQSSLRMDHIEVPQHEIPFVMKINRNGWKTHVADVVRVGGKVLKMLGEEYCLVSVMDTQVLDQVQFSEREILEYIPVRQYPLPSMPSRKPANVKVTIVSEVDTLPFTFHIKQLSGAIGFTVSGQEYFTKTRYTYSDPVVFAGDFIQDWFAGLGYETIRQEFNMGNTKAENIIGIKLGTKYPDEIVVVGAHYDSISQDPYNIAPGAIDNGSGTAGVMNMAQLFSAYETERTIHFVAFSGEEQGMYGSKAYVQNAVQNGWMIGNALIMDMISYSNRHFGVLVEATSSYTELLDAVELNMMTYNMANLTVATSTTSFGSDHVSFQKAGIPAILLIERDDTDYPYYHNTQDTYVNVNEKQSYSILRGLAATIVDLAIVPTEWTKK